MPTLREIQSTELPALCSDCAIIFNTHVGFMRYPIIEIGGKHYEVVGEKPILESVVFKMGCPSCGKLTPTRMDLFDFVDDIFNDLKRLSKPEIIYIKELLDSFKKSPSKENFEDITKKANDKRIYILGKVVSDNIGEITAILTLIGIILTGVIACIDNKQDEPKVIQYIYQNGLHQNVEEKPVQKAPYQGQLCPCGSFKKYKHCCGRKK
ncbi:SEC-C metal-binding domain-containing protein [Elizabethkingia anophelis]|uniref:SEC-C metal-binding domain-containing protein n=1 Tax=Elizabethkingia anophelis TaxID=1117645 RepID=UPI0016267C4F|nr:SEC-C metal-binding domain-containing protein [Elizabethkingia anophelis]MCT4321776.1 SEC-C domain-containing protein [Elizabethkingia anophelis]